MPAATPASTAQASPKPPTPPPVSPSLAPPKPNTTQPPPPNVPAGQPLLPGDLVFYGTPGNIHHVGLYIGNGLMIDAPDFGQVVKIEPYRYSGDDYAGATRPASAAEL